MCNVGGHSVLSSHLCGLYFRYLFTYFAHFVGLPVFFLLSYKNIFSHSVACFFMLILNLLETKGIFILMKFCLSEF